MKRRNKSGVCYICGRHGNTEIHHVFEGNGRRKISDELDAVIEVCPACHRKIHAFPNDHEWLKIKFQREIMARGMTEEEFIGRVGKSYGR